MGFICNNHSQCNKLTSSAFPIVSTIFFLNRITMTDNMSFCQTVVNHCKSIYHVKNANNKYSIERMEKMYVVLYAITGAHKLCIV